MSTGSKEHIAKETVTLSRGEAAARLRSLADEVEAEIHWAEPSAS